MEFSGTALVTGAGSGIGRALAILYSQRGCENVVLADISTAGIRETAEIIRKASPVTKILEIELDVTQQESVEAMVRETIGRFAGIDYAANVAGISNRDRVPTGVFPSAAFDEVYNVNAKGLLWCVQAELKVMLSQPLKGKQRGSIVNVASVTGLHALPNVLPYVTSKHAVMGLTKTAAVEYAVHGIRINAVCPGYTLTPMIAAGIAAGRLEEAKLAAAIPMGRLAEPEEVAEVGAFLSSSRASHVTGAAYVVDGGGAAGYGFHQPPEGPKI